MNAQLAHYGLSAGQSVRVRWRPGTNRKVATVQGIQPDGSLHLTDHRGSARYVRLAEADIIVLRRGPRGGKRWEPLRSQFK